MKYHYEKFDRMMKQSIYIETSVVSYYVARPSKNIIVAGFQTVTYDFWDRIDEFDVYISDVVIQESSKGDKNLSQKRLDMIKNFPVLEVDRDVTILAQELLNGKAIPENYPEDALHIALAARHGIETIVTWNFKHINNSFTRMIVRQIIENEDYDCPEICTPYELIGENQ